MKFIKQSIPIEKIVIVTVFRKDGVGKVKKKHNLAFYGLLSLGESNTLKTILVTPCLH